MPYHHINDMEIAHKNGDGQLDIILSSLEPSQIHIFFQNADSSYTRKSIDTNLAPWEGLAVGDIDGDGRTDIGYTGFWLQAPAQQPKATDRSRILQN